MDNELRDMIASCCKSLKLSSNLADRAMIQKGATNQEYLYNRKADQYSGFPPAVQQGPVPDR